ncbi:BZ3500_MvSof-1268-A1-R1_Chr9g10813 [Microbotryum saponariae]|uniref:BZ3500_MvSof-1268-A1-R1_Chr9g10813 protein n=1 Tax=Microbotryum saponariae TaxID=289078 RepID=A0A2X0L7Y0_9BASI|nr:BZ3501_MvSof-1269-A2-R1_Chr9g10561 [Microbotryum saponariae]SDA00738.1 BZ3500_MvSof-1268-A1-R1_Chr9g10813 [Microbotryum saponariae]
MPKRGQRRSNTSWASGQTESTADHRLEKLVGTGSTAGGWLVKVDRINRPPVADKTISVVDGPFPNASCFP